MDRVAATAGVSKITIYKHFEDKEGLFTALIKQVTAERFETVFGDLPEQDPPSVVLNHVATKLLNILAVDDEYLDFLRLIIGESGRFPALAKLFFQALPQRVLHILTEYFSSQPALSHIPAEASAQIFMGTLMSYVVTQKLLHGQLISPTSDEALIDSLIALIVRD